MRRRLDEHLNAADEQQARLRNEQRQFAAERQQAASLARQEHLRDKAKHARLPRSVFVTADGDQTAGGSHNQGDSLRRAERARDSRSWVQRRLHEAQMEALLAEQVADEQPEEKKKYEKGPPVKGGTTVGVEHARALKMWRIHTHVGRATSQAVGRLIPKQQRTG